MSDIWNTKKNNIINTKHKNEFVTTNLIPALYEKKEQQTILNSLNPNSTVVGSFAFNRQVVFPFSHGKHPATDIDIKTTTPKETALRIERNLDKNVGYDNYFISMIEHEDGKTYRVHSKAKNDVVADISKSDPSHPIPTKRIRGTQFETLKHRKLAIQSMLDDPKAEYRREKDQRMMGYIDRYQKEVDHDLDGVPNYRQKKRWFE